MRTRSSAFLLLLITAGCNPTAESSAFSPRASSDAKWATPFLLTPATPTSVAQASTLPQYDPFAGQQCPLAPSSSILILAHAGCSAPAAGGGAAIAAFVAARRSQQPSSPAQRRTRAIIAASINTLALGAVGSFLAFGKLNDDGSPEPVLRATGVGVLAVGVGIDVALLPSIFRPHSREEVFDYPP